MGYPGRARRIRAHRITAARCCASWQISVCITLIPLSTSFLPTMPDSAPGRMATQGGQLPPGKTHRTAGPEPGPERPPARPPGRASHRRAPPRTGQNRRFDDGRGGGLSKTPGFVRARHAGRGPRAEAGRAERTPGPHQAAGTARRPGGRLRAQPRRPAAGCQAVSPHYGRPGHGQRAGALGPGRAGQSRRRSGAGQSSICPPAPVRSVIWRSVRSASAARASTTN